MTCFPAMSWEYIDENMTFDRLAAMNAYWRKHPPLHELMAAYVGYQPPFVEETRPIPAGELDEEFERLEKLWSAAQ